MRCVIIALVHVMVFSDGFGGILKVALLITLLSAFSLAAPKKAPARTRAPPPPAPAVEKSPEKPKHAGTGLDPQADAGTQLKQLISLYDALDYDQVSVLSEQLLLREDLTMEQRLEACRLQGSAKAIVEDPVDAEKPFRLLLRARGDYELPENTPPKILGVFRKVQSEERALANQLQEVERMRLIANLRLLGEPPSKAQGGLPLKFSFKLRDPSGTVETVRVPYRRGGEKVYSTLALQPLENGEWRGVIPGDITANEQGFQLEYFVETVDAKGPLLSLGTQATPRRIDIAAGAVPKTRFTPIPRGLFWVSTGVTLALGITAGVLGVTLNSTQRSYTAMVSGAGPLDGSLVNARAREGESLATFANAGWISAASMLAITLLLIPFTDFAAE